MSNLQIHLKRNKQPYRSHNSQVSQSPSRCLPQSGQEVLHFNTSVIDLAPSQEISRFTSDQRGGSIQHIQPTNMFAVVSRLMLIGWSNFWLVPERGFWAQCSLHISNVVPLLIWISDILLPEPIVIRPLSTDMIACTTVSMLKVILLSEHCSFLLLVLVINT